MDMLPRLLEDIRADIENPEPYMVLADWLQESGQPWGELIAMQSALSERPGDAGIAAAIERLIKNNNWVPKHKPDDMRINWRWGFIRGIHFFDRFDRLPLAEMAAAITATPAGQMVRDCEVFCYHRKVPEAKKEALAKAFPHASVGFHIETKWADLKAGQRKTVRALSVRGEIPKAISECKSVTIFDYSGGARSLPASLGELPIERLEVSWCGALREIPDALWGLESLGYISMYDCDELGLHMGQVNNLLAGFVRSCTPSAQRIFEVSLLRDKLKKPTRAGLLRALDCNVKEVRERAMGHLEKLVAKPEAAITDGAVVVAIGKFNLDRKAITKLVEKRGGTVKTKIDAATTHVLVGQSPKGKQLDIAKLPLVLERHLTAKGNTKRAGAANNAEKLNVAKLSKDLRSKENAAVSAAIAKLGDHGEIPAELLPELFCVLQDTKLGKKGKARAKAKKLFAALAPAKLRKAVSTIMKTSVLLAGETKQLERLTALDKAAGKLIDCKKLAHLLVDDHQAGFKFLISLGVKKETGWALKTRLVKGCLDLSWLEMNSLPDLSALDVVEIKLCGNHFGSFPKDLEKQKRLTKIDLSGNYLRTLPRNMSGFKKLKVLDLSNNRFIKFPSGVVTLPALEELNLCSDSYGETRITSIPPEISKLKTLVTFLIQNSREAVAVPDEMATLKKLKTFALTWEGSSNKPPAALKKLLPGVKLS